MATDAPTLPQEVILKRWLEDQALLAGFKSFGQLAKAAGMTKNKLTICTRCPENAHPGEVVGLANALGVHWYNDLVRKWGFGKVRITLDMADKIAHGESMELGLVQHAA
jgi:hypothetical protein